MYILLEYFALLALVAMAATAAFAVISIILVTREGLDWLAVASRRMFLQERGVFFSLVALGWWALRARSVPAVMKGIGLVQTRAMATFHFLVWHLKGESLGSGRSRKEGVNERSFRYSLPRGHSWAGAAFPNETCSAKR